MKSWWPFIYVAAGSAAIGLSLGGLRSVLVSLGVVLIAWGVTE